MVNKAIRLEKNKKKPQRWYNPSPNEIKETKAKNGTLKNLTINDWLKKDDYQDYQDIEKECSEISGKDPLTNRVWHSES